MKPYNVITLTTCHERYGTVATERITSNALTTSSADSRFAEVRVSPRIARAACRGGRVEAGRAVALTADGAILGALDSATLWLKSGRSINVAACVDFGDDYGTSFQIGACVDLAEWRRMSVEQRELYNWAADHARAIRRAVSRARLCKVDWGKVAAGVPVELARRELTNNVGVDACQEIPASVRIILS